MQQYDQSYKVVILGEGRVGKTSISLRYCKNMFDNKQESTINASYLGITIQKKKKQLNIIKNRFKQIYGILLDKSNLILWLQFIIEMLMQLFQFMILLLKNHSIKLQNGLESQNNLVKKIQLQQLLVIKQMIK